MQAGKIITKRNNAQQKGMKTKLQKKKIGYSNTPTYLFINLFGVQRPVDYGQVISGQH